MNRKIVSILILIFHIASFNTRMYLLVPALRHVRMVRSGNFLPVGDERQLLLLRRQRPRRDGDEDCGDCLRRRGSHPWLELWFVKMKKGRWVNIVVYDYVRYFKEYYYPNTPTASLRIRSESRVDSASGLSVAVFLGWRSFCTASLFIPIAMHFFSLIQTMKMKCNWNEYLEDCFSFRKSTSAIRKILLTLLNTVQYRVISCLSIITTSLVEIRTKDSDAPI